MNDSKQDRNKTPNVCFCTSRKNTFMNSLNQSVFFFPFSFIQDLRHRGFCRQIYIEYSYCTEPTKLIMLSWNVWLVRFIQFQDSDLVNRDLYIYYLHLY